MVANRRQITNEYMKCEAKQFEMAATYTYTYTYTYWILVLVLVLVDVEVEVLQIIVYKSMDLDPQ